MKPFVIQQYGKSELAMFYFPKAETKKGALSNLKSWIQGNKDLDAALRSCGMAPKAHSFTPKEVALIADFLGSPKGYL